MALDPRIVLSGGAVPDLLSAVQGGLDVAHKIRNQPLLEQARRAQIEQMKQGRMQATPAGVMEFQALTQGLTPEQINQARLVELGLSPRAVTAAEKIFDIGGVPHKFDPTSGKVVPIEIQGKTVTADDVGESQRNIAEQTERGSGTGRTVTNIIDKGFNSIGQIQGNIRNIDRAISALDRGANTGAVQRFLPSITSASKELDQIQKELGLDVIGSVTFGALSEGELNLALETALPTGLDESALKDFLMRKRGAQQKLIGYYEEQINFLDQGGTPAQFIEMNRQKRLNSQSPTERAQEAEASNLSAPTVTTQEQFNALPSGALFIEDGVQYRKP